ncbi:unnamed protein product [Nesidiocoris tenuis]|uniref:Uncharacterized protein n=1 Tax=Nesidiocoris tenuis TaxID=355587 RepID=A0A6H5GCQ6_9HEMI|nr:unnamed protein product [Nesidiocoris tenuis]
MEVLCVIYAPVVVKYHVREVFSVKVKTQFRLNIGREPTLPPWRRAALPEPEPGGAEPGDPSPSINDITSRPDQHGGSSDQPPGTAQQAVGATSESPVRGLSLPPSSLRVGRVALAFILTKKVPCCGNILWFEKYAGVCSRRTSANEERRGQTWFGKRVAYPTRSYPIGKHSASDRRQNAQLDACVFIYINDSLQKLPDKKKIANLRASSGKTRPKMSAFQRTKCARHRRDLSCNAMPSRSSRGTCGPDPPVTTETEAAGVDPETEMRDEAPLTGTSQIQHDSPQYGENSTNITFFLPADVQTLDVPPPKSPDDGPSSEYSSSLTPEKAELNASRSRSLNVLYSMSEFLEKSKSATSISYLKQDE